MNKDQIARASALLEDEAKLKKLSDAGSGRMFQVTVPGHSTREFVGELYNRVVSAGIEAIKQTNASDLAAIGVEEYLETKLESSLQSFKPDEVWVLHDHEGDEPGYRYVDVRKPEDGIEHIRFARVVWQIEGEDSPACERRAKILIAAPDLYRALKKLSQLHKERGERFFSYETEKTLEEHFKVALADMGAALDKAEGRS